MSSILSVVAGAVSMDGKYLLCRRPSYKARGGLWEFPGGKLEAGESEQQALERELCEELGIEVRAGKALAAVDYAYPDLRIRLTILSAHIITGEPKLLEHDEFRWMTPVEALSLDLCPADRCLLEKIMEGQNDI